jgi:UDP-N-acetylglucosamine acyltransferase
MSAPEENLVLATEIHPTAVVHPTAALDAGVKVGPYTVIHEGCEIGAGTSIGASCTIGPWTRIGAKNVIHSHAAVGGDPQDRLYRGEQTWLVMGDGNQVREFATLNRGTTKGDGYTRIGHKNLLMACSHVAHDCVLGDRIILANNVLLAGHVIVEDGAILNGAAAIQQFTTIGRIAYVGGLTRIVQDVPPFMVVEGNPAKVWKTNIVGLQRNGYSEDQISALREAHRVIFRGKHPRAKILAEISSNGAMTPEVGELVAFLERMERGTFGRARNGG